MRSFAFQLLFFCFLSCVEYNPGLLRACLLCGELQTLLGEVVRFSRGGEIEELEPAIQIQSAMDELQDVGCTLFQIEHKPVAELKSSCYLL